jgi:hypothetical protein
MEGASLPPRRDYQRLQDDAATLPGSPRTVNNPYQSNTTKYPSSLALASQSTLLTSQTSLPKAFDNYPPSPNPAPQPQMQGSSTPVCYDYYLKPMRHDAQALGLPRYISPTTGKCRKLKIQASNPGPGEVAVSGGQRTMIRLAVYLVHHIPTSVTEVPEYFLKFLWYLISIPWTFITAPWMGLLYNGEYKRYVSRFWGQLWIARSDKEYSMHKAQLHGPSSMPLASGNTRDNQKITHAPYPRKLMIYNSKSATWSGCIDPTALINANYMAVSYYNADFIDKNALLETRQAFAETVQAACIEQGLRAYWLDFQCIGDLEGKVIMDNLKDADKRKEQAKMNEDLYRIADVYRGAAKTLIVIGHHPSEGQTEKNPWVRWGDRLWTLPEALLSRELLCKAGDDAVRPITLRQVANLAYKADPEEMALVEGFSGKDTLHRVERLSMLKNALWRRSSSAHPRQAPVSPLPPTSQFTAYPAERVYALMGFFEHRITPDPLEHPLTALARLSMANDSDRFIERMIGMLPSYIPNTACWYSENDLFNANLWDIEPEVQVSGVSKSGALVLDGCRAATIRWKNFPRVAYASKPSFRRRMAYSSVYSFFWFFVISCFVVGGSKIIGAIMLVISLVFLCISPKLVDYGTSGRVTFAQPWLIGIKGFISAKDVSLRIYGGSRNRDTFMVNYTPSGSTLSRPETGIFRRGDIALSEKAVQESPKGDIYTLVDTFSNTIYHFTARKPPTVCVYVGREAGLGRFLLCSESCDLNELHKETVVRMPTYTFESMARTDWLAVGGMSSLHGCKDE